MPELPEVQAHAERLAAELVDDRLVRVEPLSFSALKTYRPPVDAAVGEALRGTGRRGKFMLLDFGETTHVLHLMQGGRLRPDPKASKRPRYGMVRWTFERGGHWLLTEYGTEHSAGVWVIAGDPLTQPPLDALGPDADTLDATSLAPLLAAHSMRVHTFLRDQDILAGIGRRLANEICFRARLSPFAQSTKLTDEEVKRLAEAMADAVAASLDDERAQTEIRPSAERHSLVHGRTGQPCTVCGDPIRAVEYRAYTVNYCATCQTGGRILADNTTSKFLK